MPGVRQSSEVVAIAAGDIHLSHEAPLARACEEHWYDAMNRPLKELDDLQNHHKCPILYAGDIFDRPGTPPRWGCPPQLINFAIEFLPEGWAIPGQHDLPNHRYEDIVDSAYWTLVRAGILTDIVGPRWLDEGYTFVGAAPWGHHIPEQCYGTGKETRIALVHRYVWTNGRGYPGAPKEAHVAHLPKELEGYHCGIFGDNHRGFKATCGKLTIFNCGGFMRRKTDEADYRPMVGLIHADGSVTPHYLDISQDKLNTGINPALETLAEDGTLDIGAFIGEFKQLGGTEADFREAVNRYLRHHPLPLAARKILLESMERERAKA